ncbi:MAG: DUF1848 domain-containing protein [Spirochaetales bacterium]|nr:DUF1848 domain-containing protein [Spirochaetales bacterium]
MIVSVSRRTDIPAFYSDWFFRSLKLGSVTVQNPFNARQKKTVSLLPSEVDCFVFWSKNPAPLLDSIDALDPYMTYLMMTVNGYGDQLEPRVPALSAQIDIFKRFADIWGPERVIWRYDPIIFTDTMTPAYHEDNYSFIASSLQGYTKRSIISFIDLYRSTRRRMEKQGFFMHQAEEKDAEAKALAPILAEIADQKDIRIQSCCEAKDLRPFGLPPGACIDGELIRKLKSPSEFSYKRDRNQRKHCRCAASTDIGWYRSCSHGCLYCYAR